MTTAEFRRTTPTTSYLYTSLEESRAQRSSCDLEFSCPEPRDYQESFAGRNLDPQHHEFVNTGTTTTTTEFRAVLDRWGIVLRNRPGLVNGVPVGPGQITLIPPDMEVHGIYDAGREYGLISTEARLTALLGRELPHQVVAVRADPQDLANLTTAIRTYLDGDPMPDDLIAQSMRFFDVRPEQLLTPARERLASGLRELIEARLHLPISLATLCQEFGVSLRTAERAFGLRYEETMVGYIKRSRLDRARQLLLSGHSVTRAASDVGWTHLGRFSVEFRQRFGQSPSSLRKRSA